MIEHSAAYDQAVTASSRRILPLVAFDLIDPDYQFISYATNDESPYSLTAQAVRRSGPGEGKESIGTLELNRWRLDGSFTIEPDNKNNRLGQVGWESGSISDEDGYFAANPWLELSFSGVSIIQVMSVVFSENELDGIGEDFTIQFWSGNSLLHTLQITGNQDTVCLAEGFTVHYPTRVRITIHKWSTGNRRVRVPQFLIGLYEEWDGKNISSIDIYTESTFSGLSIPYSTCSVEIYNKQHRFDPYAPNSIFASIEERQAVTVKLGVRLADGSTEWISCGRYYQQSDGGWKLKDLTIQFSLLDVIGMLVKRKFVVPGTLPATLDGWIAAVIASLGTNFAGQYRVDTDIGSIPLTAAREEVEGKSCGEILRFACMAVNAWARQDMKTGRLWVSKISTTAGNSITIDNMYSYPVMSENGQISDITFQLDKDSNGNVQSVTFPGTNTECEVSLNVSNPFVHTIDDAKKALISCLFSYGGKSFQVNHRGNPTSETGDIQAVDTQFGTSISARLYKQQLKLENGVMRSVPSYLVQSPNDSTYSNKVTLTGAGTWISPLSGTVKVTVISGGSGGQGGGGGVYKSSGPGGFDIWDRDDTDGGDGGSGGRVFIVEFAVVSGQTIAYQCGAGGPGGAGGEPGNNGVSGSPGGDTTFGVFTTQNGTVYPNGIMDIQSGAVYAQTGAERGGVISGSYGSGGTGGTPGANGVIVYYKGSEEDIGYRSYIGKYPEAGAAGEAGNPGCVILEW